MPWIEITEQNQAAEYEASSQALRDFLYTYLEVCGDGMPVGDWDRAERGTVDPFRYLDVSYQSRYLFRSDYEVRVLREGAAANLLCRVADVLSTDEASGSDTSAAFLATVRRGAPDADLFEVSAALAPIYIAYRDGRIVDAPALLRAFRAWVEGSHDLFDALQAVREEIILPTFARAG